MAIRNQNWYDLNESRPYPVADSATCLSDAGERLPNDLIADLHLMFPGSLGDYAFLGAVTSSPTLIAVTILAATGPSSAGDFLPLATISLAKPITPRRSYALEAQYPGVGGWIVFGEGTLDSEYWGKFSTPAQTLLLPSTAKPYRELPVPDMAVLGGASPLTGLIRLTGGADLEIVKECREIPGYPPTADYQCDALQTQLRDVIVIRLKSERPFGAGAGARDFNVFEKYIGPCGKRPESNNCGDPPPIESLGGVLPDCCGNITLNFTGCAIVSEIREEALVDDLGDIVQIDTACGFILDCSLGLTEACVTPDRLPAPDGTLPNEYSDLCESISLVSISVPPEVSESPGPSDIPDESISAASDPDLPFVTTFPDAASAAFFDVVEGEMLWVAAGNYGSLGQGSASIRNVSVFTGTYDPWYKWLAGEFTMLETTPGIDPNLRSAASALHNAAMIMDWRAVPGSSVRKQYWLAEVDWDGEYLGYPSFRIAFFDGTSYTTYLSVALPGVLSLNTKYRIEFSAWPNLNLPGRTWLEAKLIELPSTQLASIGPLSVAEYGGGGDSQFGMHANRAGTSWSRFELSDAPF